ncbi:hypothetical protein A8B75_18655 [Sphingomonadales bacterium EhC05]|nr:hypothetical protein A8B75_18655 [Sphingomonadales bacterium EhC05]
MAFSELADWSVFDERGRRKYLTNAERERFLRLADTMPDHKRALFYFLAFTGCRISEALNLRGFHIDQDRNVVAIMTLKRRKRHFRCLPIPSPVTQMLLKLPISMEARLWSIHRTTAWRWVKEAMLRTNTVGTCHSLRHSFGVWAAMSSANPAFIQRWLGHSDIATTSIYLNICGQQEMEMAQRMWLVHSERLGLREGKAGSI